MTSITITGPYIFSSGLVLKGNFDYPTSIDPEKVLCLTLFDEASNSICDYFFNPSKGKYTWDPKSRTINATHVEMTPVFPLCSWIAGDDASAEDVAKVYDGDIVGMTDHPVMQLKGSQRAAQKTVYPNLSFFLTTYALTNLK